ncbi:MAG: hypothetical protein NZM25_04220 [Leptospiraceae bacterium]|nr:hypothetical protein [Leptospiraceae bacterium]MDW8305781.1 hypothetical protein [Leptospiraceae bacterium]
MSIQEKNFFQEVLDSATAFVEAQKGQWEHAEWTKLVDELQKKGIALTEEGKNTFGALLEGLKGVYREVQQTRKVAEVLDTLKKEVINFVQANRHGWDHVAWEQFLASLKRGGMELTDAIQAYIGRILEATRDMLSAGSKTFGDPN